MPKMTTVEINVDEKTAADVEALDTFFFNYIKQRNHGIDADVPEAAFKIRKENPLAFAIHAMRKEILCEQAEAMTRPVTH